MKILTLIKSWLHRPGFRLLIFGVVSLLAIAAIYRTYQVVAYRLFLNDPRSQSFIQWASGDTAVRQDLITVQREACPGAPFILPANGFVGLLYEDPRAPYSNRNPHQGLDIFSEGDAGVTAVYAAYDGYLTREENWKSTLIIRVPEDPLAEGEQIWLYYTHMADRAGNDFIGPAFPPGTRELFVEQGTLLGYTGDYNGASSRNVWVHLHFSIVGDDGNGRYLNELEFENSKDPSPYLGMPLNYVTSSGAMGCG